MTDSIDAAVKQAFDEVNCSKKEESSQTITSTSTKEGENSAAGTEAGKVEDK